MIIFLYGEDTYRSRQKLNKIIEQYKKIHKTGLNLKYFDLKEKNFQDFREVFRIKSMFKEKKLLILENVFANKDFKEKFLAIKKDFVNSEDIILFYELKTISNDNFFNFLKNNARCQEFQPLSNQKLKDWTKNEFEKLKIKITKSALEKLIDFVGNDLWRLSNEIKKLVAFKTTPIHYLKPLVHTEEIIEMKDIELLVKSKIEADIFKTIDAISQKNKKKGLSLIKKHLQIGDSPLYLLFMINFQFRNLLIIRDLIDRGKNYWEISRLTKLHPYVVKKCYLQVKKFILPELKEIYKFIFQIDYKIKTGQIDPETGLILLISKI